MLAYFDCFSGISGDMTLGALLDLGVPEQWLQDQLSGLSLEGFHLDVSKIQRNGIGANRVEVVCGPDQPERSYADIKELIEQSIAVGWMVVECNKYPNMRGGCKCQCMQKRTMAPTNMVCVLRVAVLGIMDEDVHTGGQFESGCPIRILWEVACAQSGLMIG